jgi:hypothetical protein
MVDLLLCFTSVLLVFIVDAMISNHLAGFLDKNYKLAMSSVFFVSLFFNFINIYIFWLALDLQTNGPCCLSFRFHFSRGDFMFCGCTILQQDGLIDLYRFFIL